MCVDTMGRPRAGSLRVSAISIVAASAIGIATLATASTQTFEVPSNRQASQILLARVLLVARPTQAIHTDNRGHAMAKHSVRACYRAGDHGSRLRVSRMPIVLPLSAIGTSHLGNPC